MSSIFICYRRADSQSATGRIYDHLIQAFGKAAVFIDVDNIPAGVDFRAAIDATIAQCAVMLVIIGPHWLTATDANGRRLDQINDRVRIEVESGLLRRMPVIPVLIEGARMPEERELPPTLAQLAYQNSRDILPNPHFEMDINRLIDSIAALGVSRVTTGEIINPPQVYHPLAPETTQTDMQRNDQATYSLIWGIASYFISFSPFSILTGIQAIKTGQRALQLAREAPLGQTDTRWSRYRAMAGIGLGYWGVGCGGIVILVLVILGVAVVTGVVGLGGLRYLP